MARSPIRKSLEHLIKKVEALEDQSFAQKLLIDELENKLQQAEETLKQVKENPFNIPSINVPFVQIPAPIAPQVQPQPWTTTPYYPYGHICTPGPMDWTGGSHCTSCGAQLTGPTWTITSTSDSTELCLADPASQSSSDVEPTLDLDIFWVIPDEPTK